MLAAVRIGYRRLKTRRDPAVYSASVSDSLAEVQQRRLINSVIRPSDIGYVATALLDAEVNGPRHVDAEEGTASLSELAAMLAARTLAPGDLVNDGSGWVSLRDFHPLADEVELRLRRDARRRWLIRLGVLALSVAAITAVRAWLLSQLGP